MLSKKEQQLLDALVPRASLEDVEIVTVDIMGSKKSPTIRIFIDTPNGVSFDELTSAQTWIDEIIDEIDPFPGAYTLEISSPGIDRPLRTLEHFARFVGETAVVKTTQLQDGRGSWTGTIVSAENDTVVLDVEGDKTVIPFENIKRANLKGRIDFGS